MCDLDAISEDFVCRRVPKAKWIYSLQSVYQFSDICVHAICKITSICGQDVYRFFPILFNSGDGVIWKRHLPIAVNIRNGLVAIRQEDM